MGTNCYVVGRHTTAPIVVHSHADALMVARSIVNNEVKMGIFSDAEGYDHAVETLISNAIEIVHPITEEA